MDADTTIEFPTIEFLKDIAAGNDHKHSASDKDEALRTFLADLASTARDSINGGRQQFMLQKSPTSPPLSHH